MLNTPLALKEDLPSMQKSLAGAGYGPKAIDYFIAKPHFGTLPDADFSTDYTGTCGDSMEIYLKLDGPTVTDAKYQVFGCAAAVAASMAVVDLVEGRTLSQARAVGDSDVFKLLEEIPAQKHHCIQLAVKTLQKALDEYEREYGSLD